VENVYYILLLYIIQPKLDSLVSTSPKSILREITCCM